jgi:patatin-like phospholipase/acyl hydrolase
MGILRAIEKDLDGPIARHVDLVAGTSVGSIVACGLGSGFTSAQIVRLLFEFAPKVFGGGFGRWLRQRVRHGLSAPRYAARPLREALRDAFGDARFGGLNLHVLVPVVDGITGELLVLDSTREPDAALRIWEVCAASSAAPTYFPAHRVQLGGSLRSLVDGGMGANNPAAIAVSQALCMGEAPAGMWCVSIGTGCPPSDRTHDDLQEIGILEWAPDLAEVFMTAGSAAMNHLTEQLLPPGHLRRLQPVLPPDLMPMDDARRGKLIALRDAGIEAAGDLHGEIRHAAAALAGE